MIINTELQPKLVGTCRTYDLVVSYINMLGAIELVTIPLGPQDMYRWDHARKNDVPDRYFKSWDSKDVIRVPLRNDEKFPDSRITEIVYQRFKNSKDFNELTIPELAFINIRCMIGTEFPDAKDATHQINTIAWCYNDTVYVLGLKALTQEQVISIQRKISEKCKAFKTDYKFTYLSFVNEVTMLSYFVKYFIKPAVAVTGWKFLRYDWMYICNRCKNLGIDITDISPTKKWHTQKLMNLYNKKSKSSNVWVPYHKIVFDYMEVYQKWDTTIYPHDSLELEDVAEDAIGFKKPLQSMCLDDLWEKQTEDYIVDNAIDSILVREIHNKISTANIFFAIANIIQCELMTAFSPVRSLAVIQARYMYEDNRVFTTDYEDDDIEKDTYEGAFVFDPVPGAFEDVAVFDFASLYPKTMMQFNISPETFVCKDQDHICQQNEIKCTSGAVYNKEKQGDLPKILSFVYTTRKQYKAEMMDAIDEMYYLNSIIDKRIKENRR